MIKSKKWNQPKKHATIRQLKSFEKEESATSKLYDSLGFHKQAMQEKQHHNFFKSEIKKQRKVKKL